MDFLCFKASHGKEFAIPISDAVSIVANPVISHVPGAVDSIVGIAKYLDAPFRMEILRGCQTSGGYAIGRQGKSWIQNPEAAIEKINRARQNFGYIRGFG